MKKRIIATMLATSVVFGLNSFAENIREIDSSSKNVVISGTVPHDMMGTGFVTILIKNGNKVEYVNETPITNGTYFSKFKFNGDVAGSTLSVRAGNQDVTSGILEAKIHEEEVECDFELVTSDGARVFNENDVVELRAKIKNVWADATAYQLLIATYDGEGNLLNAKLLDKDFEFDKEGTVQVDKITDYTVPAGTVMVKGFAWKNKQIPIKANMEQRAGETTFQDGDRVAFIGDSITHIGSYPGIIEHFYQTKNPYADYYFYNKGISGQQSGDILRRFESDILSQNVNRATIMMGVNDIALPFKYANSDSAKADIINDSLNNFEDIIKLCKANDIALDIITPVMYDEDLSLTGELNAGGINQGLTDLSNGLEALADKYGLEFYNTNILQNDIVRSARESGTMGEIIASNDRVHPTSNGYFIVAYSILKEQGVDGLVASCEINAEIGTANAKKALVSEVEMTSEGGTFMYKPQAIPLAYNDGYKYAQEYIPTYTDDMNREIIQITGLSEGEYTVKFGENEIGTYQSDELCNGINISTLSLNPNQQRAVENYNKIIEKNAVMSKLRAIALAESFGAKPSVYSSEETLEAFEMKFKNHVYYSTIKKYPEYKPYEDDYNNKLEELRKEAKEAAQPVGYLISVVKN